jgi:hypothetical protein
MTSMLWSGGHCGPGGARHTPATVPLLIPQQDEPGGNWRKEEAVFTFVHYVPSAI